MIKAEVVAHSKSPQGHELVSILATFPRIILAEVNTHRMLSKNTSSSRAIPFKKMVQSVKDNPFVPIAWQKDHPGMQGTEYLDPNIKCSLTEFIVILEDTLNSYPKDSEEYAKLQAKIKEKIDLIESILKPYINQYKSLIDWWLFARDKAVEMATILYVLNVTKQLCNRLLETFMWTTMLITGNLKDGGWDNFFDLRCPQYRYISPKGNKQLLKSKEDWLYIAKSNHEDIVEYNRRSAQNPLFWFELNEGLAEIHMMALAECIYEAINESTPKELKAGEWHIPFEDKINIRGFATDDFEAPTTTVINTGEELSEYYTKLKVKVSTAMGARTSYTIVGEEKAIDYNQLIGLDDRLLNQWPPHSSPMEHCAKVMDYQEYELFVKGNLEWTGGQYDKPLPVDGTDGWCRNFRGFIQRRHLIETNTK